MSFHAQDLSQPHKLGRYRLIAGLGQGGMGMIHLAVSEGIGGFRKLFVIKELKRELSENPQFLSLFMREAKLVARLNHPNVVHTVEADQDAGRYFLAMEFLDGKPFNEILRRATQAPAVPLGLRLQVICHALAGLHHAHELTDYDGRPLHVVHRDVSPANIFVTYDGQVKVLDFGVASAANSVESGDAPVFKGKIGYAAPEQLRLRAADRRTDVFGCGVVLWEAIALRQLVRGRPSRQVFEARLSGTEPRIAQLIDDVHPRLAEICDRATSHDPDQRYPSAEAFRQDLQAFLSEHDLGVEPGQLGAFLRTKFAHERDTLHRLIDAQLGDEGEATSAVLTRDPSILALDAAPGFAERLASAALDSVRPAMRWKRRRLRARALAGLALLAATGATAWRLRDHGSPASATTAPRPAQAAPAVSGSAAEPPAAPQLTPNTSDAGEAETAAVPSTRPETEPPKRKAAAAPLSAGASGVQGRRTEVTGSEARTTAAPPPADTIERGADVDLRALPRGQRRSLDLDNPFR